MKTRSARTRITSCTDDRWFPSRDAERTASYDGSMTV